MPSSYENWIAEIQKRAADREAGSVSQQSLYADWERRKAEAERLFNTDQSALQQKFTADMDAERKAILNPNRFVNDDQNRYQREIAQWQQKFGSGFKPGTFSFNEAAPTAPSVTPQGIYKPGEGKAGAFRGNQTVKYGPEFLDNYGRDVLGMNPQMTSLQRMLDFTDKNYGTNDLVTGTQAARDYFAKSLTDWMREQRGGAGDFSALDESMDLQKMITERLGLSYSNPDDLWAGLNKNYGYVNGPAAAVPQAIPTAVPQASPTAVPPPIIRPQAQAPLEQYGSRGLINPPPAQAPVIPGRPTGTNVMVNGRPIWRPTG